MPGVVRGQGFVALAAGVALAASTSAGARGTATAHFKVVSAKAIATLSFHQENGDQSSVSDGSATLGALEKGAGTGSLSARGGSVRFRITGKASERVKMRRRVSDTSPYQEQSCANTRLVSGSGGLSLHRLGGSVEVRWAFPQAKLSFCPGPNVGSSITAAMKHVYPASAFGKSRVPLVVAGTKTVTSSGTSLTYRWHATVTLVRS